MKILKKSNYIAISMMILLLTTLALEYYVLRLISNSLNDGEVIGYYVSTLGTIVMASVSLYVLFMQISTNNNQFSYNQQKQELSVIVGLSIRYLNIYNLDILKELLIEWQNNNQSQNSLTNELKKIKEQAEIIWLQFSFEINPEDSVSTIFISNQTTNFTNLCAIFDDLGKLFCSSYSELRDTTSNAYIRLSQSGSRLVYSLNEKDLVKAVFEDYNISYSKVKEEVGSYLNTLKSNLNNKLKIHG